MPVCDVGHGDLGQVREILARLCKHQPNSPELLWALLDSCHKDVVLDTRYALPDGRLYTGRKGVEGFFEEWLSSWSEWAWEVIDSFDTPNGVTVVVKELAVSRRGIGVEQTHVEEWNLSDGKVISWRMYGHLYRPHWELQSLEAA